MFQTEKQIEDALAPESRMISMLDGTTRSFSSTRIMWEQFDYVISWNYTAEDIVDLAMLDAKEMARSFDLSFPHVISYISRLYHERFDSTNDSTHQSHR